MSDFDALKIESKFDSETRVLVGRKNALGVIKGFKVQNEVFSCSRPTRLEVSPKKEGF